MRETLVEETVVEHAESHGWLARKMAYIGRRNCPDRWFFKAGRAPKVIEFKKFGKEPNVGQQKEHARLRAAGVEVHVIDTIAEGVALLD